jgi:hypothetical protein
MQEKRCLRTWTPVVEDACEKVKSSATFATPLESSTTLSSGATTLESQSGLPAEVAKSTMPEQESAPSATESQEETIPATLNTGCVPAGPTLLESYDDPDVAARALAASSLSKSKPRKAGRRKSKNSS